MRLIKKENGFTLIELMIVIAIMGIVCLIAIGHWENRIQETTTQKVYSSTIDFYKVFNDESEFSAETFELWPQSGNRLFFKTNLESIELTSKICKDLSSGKLVAVKKHFMKGVMATDVRFPKVKLHDEKDTITPVRATFKMIFNQEIDSEEFKKMADLRFEFIRSGEDKFPVEIKCVVSDSNSFPRSTSYVIGNNSIEYLNNELGGLWIYTDDLTRLDDVVRYWLREYDENPSNLMEKEVLTAALPLKIQKINEIYITVR